MKIQRFWAFLFATCLLGMTSCSAVKSPQAEEGDLSSHTSILIAYFSRVGNTDFPDGVDAISSASLLQKDGKLIGNTQYIASLIQQANGGDLFLIQTEEKYPAVYEEVDQQGGEEHQNGVRPKLAAHIKNMDDYDIIFLGYPIWYYDLPMAVYSFLEEYDLAGKTMIPFVTSGASGFTGTLDTIGGLQPDARIYTKGFDVKHANVADVTEDDVNEWLDSLSIFEELPQTSSIASNITGEEESAAGPGYGSQPGQDAAAAFNFETQRVMLNSGYEMPINGLGTYSLHGDTCIGSVKAALANGVRLIDTASAYGNEEEVGRAVREAMEELGIPREEIFVITKIYPGSEMADPETSIQACLDRLNLGYVDMMLLHHPDRNDVKAYKAMEKFVEEGKIHSIGLSNWYVAELTDFLPRVSIPPALVQNEIHPYYQENDVIPFIQEKGIVVQGWYPLGGRGHTAELLGDPVISEIAAAHGKSSAQVILRWNLQKGVVVIPGSSNPDHIKEDTELFDFTFTEEEMEHINALDRGEKHDWY